MGESDPQGGIWVHLRAKFRDHLLSDRQLVVEYFYIANIAIQKYRF